MERKEIIDLARKNGMTDFVPVGSNALWEQIEKFVTIAIENERETCAKLCYELGAKDDSFYAEFSRSEDCAEAIRARAQADGGEA